MRKYKYLFFLISLLTMTSCLEGNLDNLPEFEENEIVSVQRVEYRYISDEIANASGQPIVKFVTLQQKSKVDKDSKHVGIAVTVPDVGETFPAAERAKCSKSNIVVIVSLSTAARITPIGNAPALGRPGNWSTPNKYAVKAANGDVKEWTIEVTDFIK